MVERHQVRGFHGPTAPTSGQLDFSASKSTASPHRKPVSRSSNSAENPKENLKRPRTREHGRNKAQYECIIQFEKISIPYTHIILKTKTFTPGFNVSNATDPAVFLLFFFLSQFIH